MNTTAIKIASARFGWLMRVEHSNDTDTGKALTVFHWTRQKASAKPFKEGGRELDDVHEALYKDGIMHDLVREYVPWVDDR